jgi:hypothetical protein
MKFRGVGLKLRTSLKFSVQALLPLFLLSCSITAVRPAQEVSNMEVSIKAAKEVNADVLAPELFRMAVETSQRAHREYQFKNFQDAKILADQARVYAEKAEFESIRNGGKRDTLPEDPLAEPSYAPEPIGTPIPGDSGNPNPSSAPGTNGAPSVNITPKQ